ncbi:4Fe-4S binding domain-containing protein [Clostridium acidisoli DSM 12555]|uniref:4Fe-4S binding domain-containing protein n=1 Tax=Clostridium acidisoli DSM 12555 TaxID=1121291 RepID=A0A1W1XFE6_9CLOT|nr:EFR1 family ferrodoxin [Clostridium acidisoli]SMC22221.1 4Fe-4S binding domain-containing protein [Clostridium acidisoli DSM 12555]
MILYFTGTGNSEYIAKRIAELTGDSLVSMNERIKANDASEINADGRLVFVVPTYAWRIPKIVEEWIAKTRFQGAENAYFVMDCGTSIGNAKKYIKQICKRKSFQYMGVSCIVMPENYIAMYDAPEESTSRKIIENANPVISKIAEMIHKEKVFPDVQSNIIDYLNSSIVNTAFYSFIVKADKFTADDKCIGCGLCMKECPLNNIRLKGNKPVWGKECTHCMACICKCPMGAIEYGKNSVGKVRYRCPM